MSKTNLILKIKEESNKDSPDGDKTNIILFECGCIISRTSNAILRSIGEPIWIRCDKHRNSKPEDLIVER